MNSPHGLERTTPADAGDILVGDSLEVLYEERNPFNAELRLAVEVGGELKYAVLELPPLDMALLSEKVADVLTAQQRMRFILDGGDPSEFDPMPAAPSSAAQWPSEESVDGGAGSFGLAATTEGGERAESWSERVERVAAMKGSMDSKLRKASDPADLRGLAALLPPIRGVEPSRYLPITAGTLLVVSALIAVISMMF